MTNDEYATRIMAIVEEVRAERPKLPAFCSSLEINKRPSDYREVAEGLKAWANAGADPNFVLVSRSLLYDDSPYLTLQGVAGGLDFADYAQGVRGDTRPWSMTNADAWKDIANDAQLIAKQTNNYSVVVDMETASKEWHDGKADIDLVKLREALKPLADTGIRFVFHAVQVDAPTDDFLDRTLWTRALVNTFHKALPDAVFMTRYKSRRDHAKHKWLAELSDQMETIVGRDAMWHKMYVPWDGLIVDSSGNVQHYYRGAAEAFATMLLHMAPDATCVLYPGAKDYWAVGQQADALVNGGAR